MKRLYEVELNSKGAPNFSTAKEVPERKNGEWLRKLSQTPWPICSECGIYGANESNYCPHCGADMRGEEE